MSLPRTSPTQRRIHDAAIRLFSERGVAPVAISELAEAAGVSRGTVYSHVEDIGTLFGDVAAQLATELNERMLASFEEVVDPPARLALGIRWYVKMAHDDPAWSRFVTRFAYTAPALSALWSGPVVRDVFDGVALQRYTLRESDVLHAMTFAGSSVLGAMYLVREGLATWRDAGVSCAELVLRGMGLPQDEAAVLARIELPELRPVR